MALGVDFDAEEQHYVLLGLDLPHDTLSTRHQVEDGLEVRLDAVGHEECSLEAGIVGHVLDVAIFEAHEGADASDLHRAVHLAKAQLEPCQHSDVLFDDRAQNRIELQQLLFVGRKLEVVLRLQVKLSLRKLDNIADDA